MPKPYPSPAAASSIDLTRLWRDVFVWSAPQSGRGAADLMPTAAARRVLQGCFGVADPAAGGGVLTVSGGREQCVGVRVAIEEHVQGQQVVGVGGQHRHRRRIDAEIFGDPLQRRG